MRSGFVNIIGLPNAGKSSLVNSITGLQTSIVTPKPQTTRERIFSIYNESEFQIIFSDSPGYIETAYYKMHQWMNSQVESQFDDADLFLIVQDATQKKMIPENILEKLRKIKIPKFLVINKIDISNPVTLKQIQSGYELLLDFEDISFVSALLHTGIADLLQKIKVFIPEHPAFYPTDQVSDKSIRFFISELIRESLFKIYEDEIPYSCYIQIQSCVGIDDQLDLVKIEAYIMVNKESQKSILIGKNGSKIKELGIMSRGAIENYLGQKVFLSLTVKFEKNWRDNETTLSKIGIKL